MVETFTSSQKNCVGILLRLIMNGSNNPEKKLKQAFYIINTVFKEFGITSAEVDSFTNDCTSNPAIIPNTLSALTEAQKEYIVALAYEMMIVDGTFSDFDYGITEHFFNKVVNHTPDNFYKSIEKIQALSNFFKG